MLTAKLKLSTTSEQFAALRTTQLAYRDSLNFVSQYAFAHGKMSNKALAPQPAALWQSVDERDG